MKVRSISPVPVAFAALLTVGGAVFAQDLHHLSHAEASHIAIAKPQPAYPTMAKQLHLEGRVEVEAIIAEDGSVDGVRPVSGNAVLANSAVEAAKHWRFPAMPSKAVATIDFVFKL